MTRPRFLPISILGLLLVAAVGAACGDGASEPPADPQPVATTTSAAATEPESPGAATEPGPLSPERQAELERAQAKKRELADEDCRKLLESFRARVYDSVRDSGLQFLEGRVDVRVVRSDGATTSGAYDFAFNAENHPTRQTVTVPSDGAEDLPANTSTLVQRYASTGFRSAYYHVITYLPDVQLTLLKTKTDQWGVYCPPVQRTSASYVFDDQNRIVTRGVNRGTNRSIDHFEWQSSQGREVIVRSRVEGAGTETTWSWTDAHAGVYLPDVIQVRRAETTVELRFAYAKVEVTAN